MDLVNRQMRIFNENRWRSEFSQIVYSGHMMCERGHKIPLFFNSYDFFDNVMWMQNNICFSPISLLVVIETFILFTPKIRDEILIQGIIDFFQQWPNLAAIWQMLISQWRYSDVTWSKFDQTWRTISLLLTADLN